MSELVPTRTEHEPTATERLRALLDERGVEYETYVEQQTGFEHVKWNFNKHGSADFNLEFGEPWLTMYGVISGPEQAIAATLGDSDATGERQRDVEMCHDKNGFDPDTGFECTVCGTMVDSYMVTPADTGHEMQFHYCPNCGRRVVDDG